MVVNTSIKKEEDFFVNNIKKNVFLVAVLFSSSLIGMNFTIESVVGFDVTLSSLDSLSKYLPILVNDVKNKHKELKQLNMDLSEDVKKLTYEAVQKMIYLNKKI